MSENHNSKCPYCGSSLMEEEDGYRCRLCKSFFPFEAVAASNENDVQELSQLNQQVVEREPTPEEIEKAEEDKKFARIRARDELIGMATAFPSLILLMLAKINHIPYLLIPGFLLWAFAAGYTAYRVYSAKKTGRKAAYFRIAALLLVALLMFFFVKIGE